VKLSGIWAVCHEVLTVTPGQLGAGQKISWLLNSSKGCRWWLSHWNTVWIDLERVCDTLLAEARGQLFGPFAVHEGVFVVLCCPLKSSYGGPGMAVVDNGCAMPDVWNQQLCFLLAINTNIGQRQQSAQGKGGTLTTVGINLQLYDWWALVLGLL